jgi:predicted permease
MRILAYFRSLAARFLHRTGTENEIEEELRSHIQLRADDLERTGLTRAEAERRARIEFGARERLKDEVRESLGGNFLETLAQDIRYSLRVLRKSPGFTVAAVGTLALAIGANSVVFGVLNALFLRPLDIPHAQNLYQVQFSAYGKSDFSMYHSYPDYLDLRDRNRSFASLIAFNIAQVGLDTGDNPSSVWGYEASGNYFDALGIQPYLGRFFHAADEHGPNSAPYLVLAYAYWQNHFGSDRSVVGRVVRVNKHPYTIIGVAPPAFHGTLLMLTPDFFAPIVNEEQIDGENNFNIRTTRWIFGVIGHLKPSVTPAQATSDLDSIAAYLEKNYPKDDGKISFSLARPTLGGDFLGRPIQGFLTGLMLLAGLILLAACANLGSLFAARAADRSRELALRLALGAGRGRILRSLFTEAILISLAGGAIGLWASIQLLGLLNNWQPFSRFPMSVPVVPDSNVCIVALLLALVSGPIFSLVPMRQVLRTDPYQVVKAGRSVAGRRTTFRDAVLVMQIAICGVLVTSSFVAVRGLVRSLHSNFGFEPTRALIVSTDLNMAGYKDAQVAKMQKHMTDTLAALPGVDSVGVSARIPLDMGASSTHVFSDQTADFRPTNAAANPYYYEVSPGYFRAAGTTLLAGRTLSWHDDENAQRVAIVNREFARQVFGSETKAIGGFFKRRSGERVQVVGIVEDGKFFSLTEDPKPAMFLSILQSPSASTWLVVRSNTDPQQLAPSIRRAIRELDPGLPLYIDTWIKVLDTPLFPSRVATVALGVLGAMGALLSITGIFGMAAYSVSKRIRELGIRIAIGAQARQVLQAALGRPLRLLVFGSAAGLVLGLLATRVLASIVYQATPRDPLVLTGVVIAMALLGLIATWIPAQRALAADPLTLLREE